MKKSKLLIFLLAAATSVTLASGAALISGCTPSSSETTGIHQAAEEWSHNDTHHWHACNHDATCTEELDKAEHTYGEWEVDKEATATEDGSKHRECSVCGYRQTETIKYEEPGDEKPVEYEFVTTQIDATAVSAITNLDANGRFVNDETVGKFTFGAGTKPEDSGATINTQGKDMTIVMSGKTNSISFTAAGASSSGDTEVSLYKVTGEGETKTETLVKVLGSAANKTPVSLAYGTGEGESLEAGTYIIRTSRSARITEFKLVEELAKSDATGISVKGAQTKFLVNRTFATTGLNVTLEYANGRKDPLTAGYTVEQTIDMATPGKYTVTVSYTHGENTSPFTATYDVYVYGVDSLTVYDYSLNAGRVTQPVQKLFNVNDASNTANIAVHATASCTGVDGTEDFLLTASEYTVSAVDTATAGAKSVTVSGFNKTANYEVNVVDLSTVTDKYTVKVDAAASAVGVTEGVLTVKTINDAVQAFKLLGSEDGLTKTINVAAGTYKEKVEIDLPNIKLVGADKKTTIIEWNCLAGELDPSGATTYSTIGSASVSIRESAEGFYAEKIGFKNYYNTHALYQESVTKDKAVMKDTQAVACLVQADKAYFKDCFFTSYHDTLYAQTGRQVYDSCEIEGRTDYIFGDDGVVYLTGCTIRTIGANDSKNGGYIVATKGAANMEYGYVFDGCTLTADNNVVDGTVSLARGWESNMTLAFINNTISAAYSREYYGEATMEGDVVSANNKNDRYTKMNADPVFSQIFEYNNTGDGALTAEQIANADATSGLITNICTYLTQEKAAAYTKANIFKGSNANLFADDWNGEPVQVVTVTIQCGENSVKLYGYAGGYLAAADITEAQYALIPSGYVLDKYTSDADGLNVVVPGEMQLTSDTTIYLVTKVREASEAVPETWMVSSIAAPAITIVEAGSAIVDSNALTVTSTVNMVYAAITNSNKPENVTAGYKQQDNTNSGSTTGDIVFTAKGDMTLTVYFVLANDSYNSHRAGNTITYTVSGQAAQTITSENRNVLQSATVQLLKGQTLTINATITGTSAGKLWLFGYEVAAPATT